MNNQNSEKIDQYIAQNPECKLQKTESVILKGKSQDGLPTQKKSMEFQSNKQEIEKVRGNGRVLRKIYL